MAAVNGEVVSGLISVTVHRNNHLAADIFSVVIALARDPDSGAVAGWFQADRLDLTISIAENVGGATPIISGLVDDVSIEPATSLLTLSGRDYTALFIEAKTAEKFQNLTSSQVVTTLASRHGLIPQVTSTATPTGKFYDSDHAVVTNEVSEWTLLCFLAQQEGFEIFVEGRIIFFQPATSAAATTPFDIYCDVASGSPGPNVQRLVMRRRQQLAQDVLVKIISWNHEHKTAITAIRRARKVSAGANNPISSSYVFRESGLTQDQANNVAATKLGDIIQHERVIEFDLPGNLRLSPRSLIRLSGTGTAFDQIYGMSQIQITCSLNAGFTMRVKAKNSSPFTVTTT